MPPGWQQRHPQDAFFAMASAHSLRVCACMSPVQTQTDVFPRNRNRKHNRKRTHTRDSVREWGNSRGSIRAAARAALAVRTR